MMSGSHEAAIELGRLSVRLPDRTLPRHRRSRCDNSPAPKPQASLLKGRQLLKEARDTKDRIIAEAKEQAKVEANKIITDANAAIQQQKMAALTDVKNQVGALVIDVAEKVLRRELTDKSQQEKYIKQLAEEVKLN